MSEDAELLTDFAMPWENPKLLAPIEASSLRGIGSPRSLGSNGEDVHSMKCNRCLCCCCCCRSVRCTVLRGVATIWFMLLLVGTIALPVFIFFLWCNQGSNAYEQPIQNTLKSFAADGLRFVDICRFKQWTGTAYFTNPNIFGMIHHEGVLLNTVTADGIRKGFFQLDYGHYGTFSANIGGVLPVRLYGKAQMNWEGSECPYICGKIPRRLQSPVEIVRLFEEYRPWKYNVFWYNCFDFARLVWNWTQPTDIGCVSDMKRKFMPQSA